MLKTKLIKLSQNAVVSLFLSFSAVSPVLAQEASYTTIEPTLNAQCVDSPPLGDGFGWNGRCGCELEPEWSEFGHTVALSGNTLVIAAKDTPENCPGSAATFSIYEKSSFGSWVKETELNLDENGSIQNLDFFDEKLLVDAGSQRRIFEKIEGQWQLVSTLAGDMNQAPGQFVRTSRPSNDLLEYTFGDRDINGNETIQSHIQTETNSLRIVRYDDIAVASSDRDQAIFLSENSAGHWQVDQQVSLVNFARGSMVLEDSILIVDTRDNIQSLSLIHI